MASKDVVAVKSLYTPVFYATPSSTPTSSVDALKTMPKPLLSYLGRLSRRHLALAQIVEEVPPSRGASPLSDDEVSKDAREDRVDALRRRIVEAVNEAHRNPSHGKWENVSQLVRMGCTRGRYRWATASLDPPVQAEPAVMPKDGWFLAETEAEWLEWESRREKAREVKEKVQTWQQRISESTKPTPEPLVLVEDSDDDPMEGPSHRSINVEPEVKKPGPRKVKSAQSGVQVQEKITRTSTTHDLKDQTSLRFKVAKRSSLTLAATLDKPKPKQQPRHRRDNSPDDESVPSPESHSPAGKVKPHDNVLIPASGVAENGPIAGPTGSSKEYAQVHPAPDAIILSDNSESSPLKMIGDISDMNFIPPSFPSNLETSTPNWRRAPAKPSSKSRVPAIQSVEPNPLLLIHEPPSPRFSSSQEAPTSNGRHRLPPSSSSLPALPSTPTYPRLNRQKHGPSASNHPDKVLKETHTLAIFPPSREPASSPADEGTVLVPPSPSPIQREDTFMSAPIASYAPTTGTASTFLPGHAPESYFDSPIPEFEPPTTPKRTTPLPTLTELLATSRKRKAMAASPKSKASPKRLKPTSTVTVATSPENTSAQGRSKTRAPFGDPGMSVHAMNKGKAKADDISWMSKPDDLLVDNNSHRPKSTLLPTVGAVSSYEDLYGVPMDVDLSSPAKSLSSLAGSDSEDSADDGDARNTALELHSGSLRPGDSEMGIPGFSQNPAAFVHPQKKLGMPGDDALVEEGALLGAASQGSNKFGAGFGVYNSQFDVEGEVGRVNDLLEKDVDFDGWLRDVSGDEVE